MHLNLFNYPLTKLERDVATLVFRGHKAPEISKALGYSIGVVKATYCRIRLTLRIRGFRRQEIETGNFYRQWCNPSADPEQFRPLTHKRYK